MTVTVTGTELEIHREKLEMNLENLEKLEHLENLANLANLANVANLVNPWYLHETETETETGSPGPDPTEGAQVRMEEIDE